MAKPIFGVHLPSSSSNRFKDIVTYAKRCEILGFDSVWVADHILSGTLGSLYEPLTSLAALSGATEKIHLGTSVLIASLRNPILLADIAGTIQESSGGRLMLGVGAGWDRREFDALGMSFEERGAITDECLEIVQGLWKGEALNFEGTHFTLKDVKIGTPPHQLPPIWIGGNSNSAIRRAAKYDAWFPTDPNEEEINRGKLELTRLTKARGGSPIVAAHIYLMIGATNVEAEMSAKFLSEQTGDTIDMVKKWAIVGDYEAVKERIANYIGAGVQYFVFSFPHKDYEVSLQRAARVVSEF
jgi:probable F420-dependent oxidoreductase